MKLKYSALLFDLDGTLTDSAEGIVKSFQHALTAFGIVENDAVRLNSILGPPLYDSFRGFYPQLTEEEVHKAIALYRKRYRAVGMYENSPYPGIPELLDRLKAAGYFLAVATAKPELFALPILEHYDLLRRFDAVFGCDESIGRISKTAVIRDLLAAYPRFNAENAVMIGDRGHDVEGAAANGLDCIGVLYGFGSLDELTQAGAKYTAATVEDLGELLL